MARKTKSPPNVDQQPHVIHERGVYTAEQVRRLLGLADGTIRREVREGKLRVAERCNRYYFLGSWLLEWITSGERPRRKPAAAQATSSAGKATPAPSGEKKPARGKGKGKE